MRSRILIGFIIAVFTFTLPGCWDRREVEELAIMTALGIDTVKVNGEDLFKISYLILRPGATKGGQGGGSGPGATQAPFYLMSATGKTIFDANRNLSARISRYQFVAPVMAVIVGEKVAKMGAAKYVDIFERHRDFRLRSLIFVVKGEAIKAMAASPEIENSLADEIRGIAQNSQPYYSKGFQSDLLQFLGALSREGSDTLLGKLEVFSPPENDLFSDKEKETNTRPENTINLTGAGVIKQGKLVGFLSNEEARGFLFVTGKAQKGALPLDIPSQHGDKVSISMMETKSKIKPVIQGDKLKFKIKIEITGDLYEHEGKEEVATPEMMKTFEDQMAVEVKESAQHTIDKAQHQFKADIFGFGESLMHKNPKLWEKIKANWRDDFYAKAAVEVEVKAHINTTGQITNTTVK